jgi:hypothetical protein
MHQSSVLLHGVRAPVERGWQEGNDDDRWGFYDWLCYKHPDSETTYFAVRRGTIADVNGITCHRALFSSIRGLRLPPKPDYNVSERLGWWRPAPVSN